MIDSGLLVRSTSANSSQVGTASACVGTITQPRISQNIASRPRNANFANP